MLQVSRYRHEGSVGWGLHREGRLVPFRKSFETTGALLQLGMDAVERAAARAGSDGIELGEVELLSPVTENQQIVCLAKNYREHAIETGFDPDAKVFNMWFRKASSCLCGARDDIVRPARVRLLDYEVELGLVLGRDVLAPQHFDGRRLPDPIGALVVHNDVSARWLELRLQMRVNGELRQDAVCADMIYKPPETLTELSEVQSLRAGDLVASGTPSGVALQRSPEQNALLSTLPASEKWAKFIELQEDSGRYLRPGDRVQASIRTDDGTIDLGALDNVVSAR